MGKRSKRLLEVAVEVPVPEGEDPEQYAERVAGWSLPTLQQGRIVDVEVAE